MSKQNLKELAKQHKISIIKLIIIMYGNLKQKNN